jgi:acyl-CoA thioesterase-1
MLTALSLLLFSCGQNPQQQDNETTEASAQQSQNTEAKTENEDRKVILFFGNSLTAGYGLDEEEAYPALIQDKLDSLGLHYQVINAGLSGETTASGDSRLEWVLERQPVDIFVLELGANDGLRGINPEETRRNLISMIRQVEEKYPEAKIILSGMMVPPNMGPEFSEQFREVFPEVAQEEEVMLIPFLLEGVAGEPELNQADGIHPTAEGQEIVAENVWQVLQNAIEEESSM